MAGFSLPIQNPTIGGGTAFTQQILDILNQLSGSRNFRAGLSSDLLSQTLNRQLEAARSPINLVDRLLLSGQVGSINPLSQASQEQLGRFTSRPQTNLSGDLLRRLEMFTIGALTPEQQVQEGFDPATGIKLSSKQRDFIRADATNRGITPGQFADEPLKLAHGGRLTIDPNRAVSRGTSIAGPASVVDRTGRQVALAGEAGQAETLSVTPGQPPSEGVGSITPQSELQPAPQLRRDEQFRLDELRRLAPGQSPNDLANIARFPGGFEQFLGLDTDPRAAGARLIGGSLAADVRFRDPLVRSLALGRAPTPGEITAREFSLLPPDTQDAIISVVGPDLARQFFFELEGQTPRGLRTRIAGPVAA